MSALSLCNFIVHHPLNKGHAFQALNRFARWQIGSRLTHSEIVFNWINGSKFFVRTGETGLTGNIYTGLHEFPDMGFLLHFLRKEDVFIDVGANVGSYTILACSAIGASGYAIEPIPTTYLRLVENVRLNHIEDSVKCLNIGIGRECGSVSFTNDLDTMNHALTGNEETVNAVEVKVLALDAVLDGVSPALIKIDVEGYETQVLEGAPKVLKSPTLHSVIMELNGNGQRYGYNESQILEMMFDYGFRTYAYNPFDRTLTDLKGKNLDSGNTIFIRGKEAVQERIKASQKFTVFGRIL